MKLLIVKDKDNFFEYESDVVPIIGERVGYFYPAEHRIQSLYWFPNVPLVTKYIGNYSKVSYVPEVLIILDEV